MTIIYSKARSSRLKTKIERLKECLFCEMDQHRFAKLKMFQSRDAVLTHALKISLWRLIQAKLRGCDNTEYLKSLDSDAARFDQSLNRQVMLGSVASSAKSYFQDFCGSVDTNHCLKENEEMAGKEVDDEVMLSEEEIKRLDILDEDPWWNRGSPTSDLFCDEIYVEQEIHFHGASIDEEQTLFEGSDRGAPRSYLNLPTDDSRVSAVDQSDQERLDGFGGKTYPASMIPMLEDDDSLEIGLGQSASFKGPAFSGVMLIRD